MNTASPSSHGPQDADRQAARYRSLVDATAAIVWTTGPEGEFDGDQPQWRAFTGQSPDELRGAGWLDAIHPDDRAATSQAWSDAVARSATYSVRHRLRAADGSYRLMQARAVPVRDDGAVVEWVGVHDDVSAEQAAADERSQSEARLRALFDAVADVVLVYPLSQDGPGPLRFANRAASDTYGYSADELTAMTVLDILDPDSMDLGGALAELRRTRAASFESWHRTRDGRRLPMKTKARVIELDGELHVVALARDDSEGRQFRRELARANLRLEREVEARTAELRSFSEDLKILHALTTAEHATPEARFAAYLSAGCEMFDLPVGILSSTPTDPETGQRLYRLEAVVSPDPEMKPGLTVPLREAFCDAVVASGETVVYADAAVEAPEHPACAGRGLRAFIGTPVRIGGDIVGTLNFVSPEPRPGGFTASERELVEVMAGAVAQRLRLDHAAEAEGAARGLYRTIVETVDEAVIVVDRDDRLVLSNPAARASLGVEGAESEGAPRRRWPVLDARGQAILADDLPERQVLRTGEPVRGEVQGVRAPDGATRWYRVNATPIDADADGAPEAVVVSFGDVTEMQARSARAQRMRALLASVLDASADGVMAFRAVRGPDGAIEDFEWLLANARAGDITGQDPSALIGRRLLDVFPGNREAGLFDAYAAVVETGERFETLVTYPHDGLDTSFRITATPIEAEDGFTVTFAEVLPAEVLDVEPDA